MFIRILSPCRIDGEHQEIDSILEVDQITGKVAIAYDTAEEVQPADPARSKCG